MKTDLQCSGMDYHHENGCQGNVKKVKIYGSDNYFWGYYQYCQEIIDRDERRGFRIEIVEDNEE